MNRHAVLRWLMVGLWISIILVFAASPQFSSRSTEQAAQSILQAGPQVPSLASESPQTPKWITQLNHWARRSAHAILYSALGFLLFQAWRLSFTTLVSQGAALLGALLIAMADEGIQSLMPDRSARWADVRLDLSFAAGAIVMATLLRLRKRPRQGIIQGITLAETGGAQRVAFSLLEGTAHRWPTSLVCGGGKALINWVEEATLPIVVYELSSIRHRPSLFWDLRALWDLIRVFRRTRPLIAHFHSSKMGLLGRVAAWLAGVPHVLYTAHGWPLRDYHGRLSKLLYTWLERIGGLLTDQIICVSESERETALRYRVAPAEKLTVIHNGVAPAPQTEGLLRRELACPPNTRLVVAIGRLAEPKDPFTFICLASDLVRTYPDIQLVWLGDGPLLADCIREVRQADLEGRVHFLGNRPDARELLNDAEIMLLPTKAEALPLVVLEAMWAGKPVVASHVGGVAEAVVGGVTGLLIPPGDLSAWSAAVSQLLDDSALRERYGSAGRDRVQERFSGDAMTESYLRLYQSLLIGSSCGVMT